MRVLVTGCNGFIGKKISLALITSGHEVIGVDITHPDASLLSSSRFDFFSLNLNSDPLPESLGVDCVVHLAITMMPKKNEAMETLLEGTHKLLKAMEKERVPYLIGMSSMSVLDYDGIAACSMVSEDTSRCINFETMGRYAQLKSMQEKIFLDYGKFDWASVGIIRPGLVYEGERLNNAYVGVVKNQFSFVVSNDGFVPLVEINSLIDGILKAVDKVATHHNTFIVNFVNDSLPTQTKYIEYLQHHGQMRGYFIKANWRVVKLLVDAIYAIFKFLNLHHKLPDLFMPQAFSTRLKPFDYSNQFAQEFLGWKPAKLIYRNATQ